MASHYLPLIESNWFKLRSKYEKKKSQIRIPTRLEAAKKATRRRKRSKRKELMRVLANVEFILIKANYKPKTTLVG